MRTRPAVAMLLLDRPTRFRLAAALPVAALLACAGTAAHAADERYLCQSEMSAGLTYDRGNKQWTSGTLASEGRYIVKRSTPEIEMQGYPWSVWELGKSNELPDFACRHDFSDNGHLLCEGYGEFRLNRKNLRFLSTTTVGYVDDGLPAETLTGTAARVEGQDTPLLRAGRCSAF